MTSTASVGPPCTTARERVEPFPESSGKPELGDTDESIREVSASAVRLPIAPRPPPHWPTIIWHLLDDPSIRNGSSKQAGEFGRGWPLWTDLAATGKRATGQPPKPSSRSVQPLICSESPAAGFHPRGAHLLVRTPGSPCAAQSGREHYLLMCNVFAGGGIQRGTVIGATVNTFGERRAAGLANFPQPFRCGGGWRASCGGNGATGGASARICL